LRVTAARGWSDQAQKENVKFFFEHREAWIPASGDN